MKWPKPTVSLCVSLLLYTTAVLSQGVTTSSMRGKVVDESNNPVFAATVIAVHSPTGTQYGTITNDDGIFNIRNMRIGGPYDVRVTYVGYEEYMESGIFLQLNKTADLSITLIESLVQLEEVSVLYDKSDVINSDRTGAMTNVSREEIRALPSIKRSQRDLTRMTPESDGNSFGGRNNLYNNFSLDGSIFNNPFGLDYAVPGGQTDAQPVSLDAIDQIQVSLAPFDVREGGFTGAGVNAVTKSGTNEISGTAYYFGRNEALVGKKVGDKEKPTPDFSTSLFGATVGGPIVRDKLFFFVSAEGERRNELAHDFVADNASNSGENVTAIPETDIRAVQAHFRNRWGYDPGAYQGYYHETYNNKLLVKLDMNFTRNHNATLRYNMLDSWKDILPHPEAVGGRGPTPERLPFENSSYRIFNLIHSLVGEVNSIFSNKLSNRMMVGFTAFRDRRQPFSEPYPVIDIWNDNGITAITAGSEMFSTHNRLYQDVFQFTDNLTLYMDRHTFTAGLNLEVFTFDNSFNLFYYPLVEFMNVNDFLNDNAYDKFTDTYFTPDFDQDVIDGQQNPYSWAYVDVGQLAVYLQDEWSASDKLKLTLGFRVDIPMYFNEIPGTDAVKVVQDYTGWVDENENPQRVDPTQWPDPVPLFSPRFGFNYDVKGDNTLQLRGGTGIFTGRIPFVWLGNQSSNPGISATSPFDYTFQVNATANKFRWPQVWKTNLALDAKAGERWIFTVEGIFGKDLNAIVHRNYNSLKPSGSLSGSGDNREYFSFPESNIYSADANTVGFLDAGTIILDNTPEGYQLSTTGKIAKVWDFGLRSSLAYTWLSSKDYTSIPAEIAGDAYQRNPVVGNPNFPEFSWSRYGLNHRIIGSALFQKEYGFMASTVGLFLEVARGNRYSFVYSGDINGDGSLVNNNDLIYVPTDINDINFGVLDVNGDVQPASAAEAQAQWAVLDAFIEQDEHLKDRRGKYAQRNGASLPWFSQIDIRYMHDLNFDVGGKVNTLQLSLDLLNAGNLINSNWGVRKLPSTLTPISVLGVDGNNVPWLSVNPNLKNSYVDDFSVRSKWQIQLGLRYIFN